MAVCRVQHWADLGRRTTETTGEWLHGLGAELSQQRFPEGDVEQYSGANVYMARLMRLCWWLYRRRTCCGGNGKDLSRHLRAASGIDYTGLECGASRYVICNSVAVCKLTRRLSQARFVRSS